MKTVNAFLVIGDAVTLVDTGENSPECWEAMTKGLNDNGLTINDIDEIVITHAHVDHMGMARRISDESGAKVMVSDLVKDWAVDQESQWTARTEVMKNTFTNMITKEKADMFFGMLGSFFGKISDYWLELSEDQIDVFDHNGLIQLGGHDFQSIHAPGHTHTQTCFYEPNNRDLITADMLLKITPTCVLEFDPTDHSKRNKAMPYLLHSFRKFREMDIDRMYPGHYDLEVDHRELIDRQLSRINMRKEQAYQLIKSGTNQFLDIFNTLYEGRISFPGLVMTVGYLDLLEAEELISPIKTEDCLIFQTK